MMWDYMSFMFMRALTGVFAAGALNTTFVIAVEIAPTTWRAWAKGILAFGWVLSKLSMQHQ